MSLIFYCLIPHFSEFVEQFLSTLYMWCTHTHAALESQRCLRNEEICLYGQSWQMRFYEEFATFNLKITTSLIMLCTELMFQNSVQCSGLWKAHTDTHLTILLIYLYCQTVCFWYKCAKYGGILLFNLTAFQSVRTSPNTCTNDKQQGFTLVYCVSHVSICRDGFARLCAVCLNLGR